MRNEICVCPFWWRGIRGEISMEWENRTSDKLGKSCPDKGWSNCKSFERSLYLAGGLTEEDLRNEWEENSTLKGSLGPDHGESSKSSVRILGFILSVIGIHWRVSLEEWCNQIYTCKRSLSGRRKIIADRKLDLCKETKNTRNDTYMATYKILHFLIFKNWLKQK